MRKTILAFAVAAFTALTAVAALTMVPTIAGACPDGQSENDNGKCVDDSRGSHH